MKDWTINFWTSSGICLSELEADPPVMTYGQLEFLALSGKAGITGMPFSASVYFQDRAVGMVKLPINLGAFISGLSVNMLRLVLPAPYKMPWLKTHAVMMGKVPGTMVLVPHATAIRSGALNAGQTYSIGVGVLPGRLNDGSSVLRCQSCTGYKDAHTLRCVLRAQPTAVEAAPKVASPPSAYYWAELHKG